VDYAVSVVRSTILHHIGSGEPDEPQVDYQAILDGLDAVSNAVAELRKMVTQKVTPVTTEDGKCLHPSPDRREAGTFSQVQPYCGRCGEFL
jgi:hypothetical protein